MREIKFRAWHKEKKCWLDTVHVYGDSSWSGSIIEPRGEIDGYDERECELMQYTGLKDKNGKEIYEGDIIKSCNQYIENITASVMWNDNCARFVIDSESPMMNFIYGANLNRLEVIGNIYENPELLKGK